ncbi:MAG TPA: hypothetical protein VGN41_14590 [Streptosporangiaceae bacterium]
MSDRPRIELNTVQLVASVLAAVTGAVLTSYLGVGGTVAGTALGSLATTSGFAIYKHYLGRTKERIDHVAPVIVEHARVWTPPSGGYHPIGHTVHHANGAGGRSANGAAAWAGSTRPEDQQTQPMQVWDPGRPADSGPAGPAQGDPAQAETAQSDPAQAETAQGDPAQAETAQAETAQADTAQARSGEPARQLGTVRLEGNGDGGGAAKGARPGIAADGGDGARGPGRAGGNGRGNDNGSASGNGSGNRTGGGILRGRPRWVAVALTSAAVFAVVIAAITVFEGATGKPLSATVRGERGSGTTLGGGSAGSSGSAHSTPQPTQSAAPSQSATSPSAGQIAPQPSSRTSTSPAPSSVPSPSAAPSVRATPPAPSAPVRGVPPSG